MNDMPLIPLIHRIFATLQFKYVHTFCAFFLKMESGFSRYMDMEDLRRLPPEGSIPGTYTCFEASGVGVVLIDRFIHDRLYWNEFLFWLARRKNGSHFHISLSTLI